MEDPRAEAKAAVFSAYWLRVLRRAAKDAWASVVGHGLRSLMVLVAVNAGTLAMYYARSGWAETVQQVTALAYAVVATLSVFGLAFFVFVLKTPPVLAAEAAGAGPIEPSEPAAPFAIRCDFMAKGEHFLSVNTFILNRSPSHRVALEFQACFVLTDGTRLWLRPDELGGIQPGLAPQEYTAGMLSFSIESQKLPEAQEIKLQVVDRVSGRWALFKLTGSFPPGFFRLSPSADSSA